MPLVDIVELLFPSTGLGKLMDFFVQRFQDGTAAVIAWTGRISRSRIWRQAPVEPDSLKKKARTLHTKHTGLVPIQIWLAVMCLGNGFFRALSEEFFVLKRKSTDVIEAYVERYRGDGSSGVAFEQFLSRFVQPDLLQIIDRCGAHEVLELCREFCRRNT